MENRRADAYKFAGAKVKDLSTAMTRLLSFLDFRHDLMMRVLEFHSASNQIQRTNSTPPSLGTSLRDYMLHHGGKGIKGGRLLGRESGIR